MTTRKDSAATASTPAGTSLRPVADPIMGEIAADRVYNLKAFCRRMAWGEHAVRQARAAGLRMVAFGRERFVLGADVLDFFRGLADRQAAAVSPPTDGGSLT